MGKHVDYYLTPISPYSYLGHARFVAIARRHDATIAVKPINLGKVFPVSGGVPLSSTSASYVRTSISRPSAASLVRCRAPVG